MADEGGEQETTDDLSVYGPSSETIDDGSEQVGEEQDIILEPLTSEQPDVPGGAFNLPDDADQDPSTVAVFELGENTEEIPGETDEFPAYMTEELFGEYGEYEDWEEGLDEEVMTDGDPTELAADKEQHMQAKLSLERRREHMTTQTVRRPTFAGELPRTSGDFTTADEYGPGTDISKMVQSAMDTLDGEEEEYEDQRYLSFAESSEEVEEERVVEEEIDLEKYTYEYNMLRAEHGMLRRKNNFLQRKLVEHFKKRRMDAALKPVDPQESLDLEVRYNFALDTLAEVQEWNDRERKTKLDNIANMRKYKNDQLKEINEKFEHLMNREQQVATGLIFSKTGKPIPDKLVERLVKRQLLKNDQLSKYRLKFIRSRDRVTEIETALKSLETVGDNLYIVDYEQMRMENQSFSDKIEERDEELGRLRDRCAAAIQTLAHVREKSHATAFDINEESAKLQEIISDLLLEREELTALKVKRDACRNETSRLREISGLLTKNDLLRDFEDSISKVEELSKYLDGLKDIYKNLTESLRAIRKHLELCTAESAQVKTKAKFQKSKFLTHKSLPKVMSENIKIGAMDK